MGANKQVTHSDTEVAHVVILVHGIRDFAGWQEDAKRLFELNPNVRAVPIKFGWYDVLSFLAPRAVSKSSFQVLLRNYEQARNEYPNAPISVVAHSYGTYLVGNLLLENPSVKLFRILLCGAVLKRDYDWGDVRERFGTPDRTGATKHVLNECGSRDFWPVVADLCRSRYGASGRHGLDATYVENAWFAGGHGLFFKKSHMRDVWVKFILSGELPAGNSNPPKATWLEILAYTIPGFQLICRSILTFLWLALKYWMIVILGMALLLAYQSAFWNGTTTPGGPETVVDPIALFQNFPSAETVERDKVAYLQSFILKYRNLSNCNCKILLYDITLHHAGQSNWREIPVLKNTLEYQEYKRFFGGAGWYGIAIETPSGDRIKVGVVNLTTFGKSSLTILGDDDNLRYEWAD